MNKVVFVLFIVILITSITLGYLYISQNNIKPSSSLVSSTSNPTTTVDSLTSAEIVEKVKKSQISTAQLPACLQKILAEPGHETWFAVYSDIQNKTYIIFKVNEDNTLSDSTFNGNSCQFIGAEP
jgi:hypothetical protein